MENEPGDEYIRRIATYIRTHEQRLAAAAITRRRRGKLAAEPSVFNPLGWFATSDNAAPSAAKPIIMSFDIHHLFYLLMRLEALGIDVGSLDVWVDSPSRPMNYINVFPASDKSDALSLVSFRSSLSAVSRLSLGAGWFRAPPPTLDAELKYIYSSFTKLPALSLHAPEAKLIVELATEAPNENALPMDAFKNLQTLQCTDIDPRTLLGWDRLAESLWSLSIKNSGLEDVSDIFIGAVLDDQARREGRAKDSRTRRVSKSLSRPQSFYGGSRLPESVPEDAEDEEDSYPQSSPEASPPNLQESLLPSGNLQPSSEEHQPTSEHTPKSTPRTELPSLKWAFLRHLSLADNALTFLPTSLLPYLTSLTHLDLSSNLLVSVPPGLQTLYNLTSLNLSDNMIDSVLGIYTVLGQVLYLNLSKNRLESICGLERLLALERVDLRNNLIEESAEVGRLATLPNISEVWIEGNPFTEIEEGYRIRCFDLFTKEGKSILLDGSPPSFYEKMYLTSPPPQQMTSTRPPSVAYTPPVVAVGSPVRNGTSPVATSPQLGASSHSSPPSNSASPHVAAVQARGRRKKNKRIVDFNGDHSISDAASFRTASQARIGSEAGGRVDRTRSPKSTKAPLAPAAEPSHPGPSRAGGDLSTATATAPATAVVVRPTPKSRHSRNHTEHTPTSFAMSEDSADSADNALQRGGSLRKAGAVSRSAKRRSRVSASMYQSAGNNTEEADQFQEADAFRARIEALRSDMGDGWLKVFNQSQLSSPPPTGVPSG